MQTQLKDIISAIIGRFDASPHAFNVTLDSKHESSPCVWIYYNLWKKKQLRTTYPTFFGQPRLHKSFVKKYKNGEQALDFIAWIYGGRCPLWNLGSIVWWHTFAITCQIIMLTCQIFMSSCQIFMLTCKSLCWLVTYSFVKNES